MPLVDVVELGILVELPGGNQGKAWTRASHPGTWGEGFTRHAMVVTGGCQAWRWSQSQKADRSPDLSLQLDAVKSESRGIADQHAAVNTFPGLVHTARHTMGVGFTRSR